MATGKGVDQGKTAFLNEYLRKNPHATEPDIVEAWGASGREGTISGSLIYKVRTKLGLSGKNRKAGASKGPAVRGRPKGSGATRGRPRADRTEAEAPPAPRATTKSRRLDQGRSTMRSL